MQLRFGSAMSFDNRLIEARCIGGAWSLGEAHSQNERLWNDRSWRKADAHTDKSPNLASPNTAPDIHCCTGPGKAGSSIEVPSGSTMKSGGEPDGGAGGPSSTKHTICTSREKRLVLPEETNATPARFRAITVT